MRRQRKRATREDSSFSQLDCSCNVLPLVKHVPWHFHASQSYIVARQFKYSRPASLPPTGIPPIRTSLNGFERSEGGKRKRRFFHVEYVEFWKSAAEKIKDKNIARVREGINSDDSSRVKNPRVICDSRANRSLLDLGSTKTNEILSSPFFRRRQKEEKKIWTDTKQESTCSSWMIVSHASRSRERINQRIRKYRWDFPVFLSFRNGNELIKFYVASFSSLPSCLSFCTNFVWNDQFGK